MTTIERVTITPVAFRDPPLLNAVGVHEPFALRSIIQLHTNDGLVGLGESYGDGAHLERLRVVGESMTGLDPFHTHRLRELTVRVLGGQVGSDTHGLTGHISAAGTALRTFASFEVACLDLQGKVLGRPVSDLLAAWCANVCPTPLPLLQVGGPSGHSPRRLRRSTRPRWHRGPGPLDARHLRLRRHQIEGGVFEPDEEIDTVLRCARHSPTFPYGSTERGVERGDLDSRRHAPAGCSSISRIRRPLAPG